MKLQELFTKEEVRDLAVSTIAISLIFAFPRFEFFFFYLIAVVFAFVFHELAHKFVAMKFHCAASYEMWPLGLGMGFLFMLFGIKILAPGAVIIRPYRFGRWGFRVTRLTVPENGIISLAGPVVNLAFALIFYPFPALSFISDVNAWLAFFNLLPIPPLDGSKVIRWKPWVWLLFIITAFILMSRFF
ncbi:MAG: site-2 protease family protein [Candidatus Aenigmatarchaeota archaeon]